MHSPFASTHSHDAGRLAVLDTQAVLDWWYFEDPACAGWEATRQAGLWVWIAGPLLRAELAHVLGRGELPPIAGRDADTVLAAMDARVRWLDDPAPAVAPAMRCTDPDDQKFIEHALAHRAHWLVSRDRAVLKLARRARTLGLQIVKPTDWAPEQP